MSPPRVLLFDLGGVLIEFVGLEEMRKLLLDAINAPEIRRRWIASKAIVDFETGRCSRAEFAAQFVAEWQLAIDPQEFLRQFAIWTRPPLPATLELLGRLRQRYRLACLSNTNEIHWATILETYDLRAVLDRHFSSHELGLHKPNREIFTRVAGELGCAPHEIVFFDDNQENVSGAIAAGLQAHRVAGPEDLPDVIGRLALL